MKLALYSFVLPIAACAVACAATPVHTIELVNRTPRTIAELYVYPQGATAHGASRGQLAPNASTKVSARAGMVEVMAVSAKVQLDEHTRDQPSVTQGLELTGPQTVIFYDVGHKPPEVNQRGVVGAAFTLAKSNAPAPAAAAPAPTEGAAP